jgi:CRISPR/Cas system-associated exonuclease Cas4 (RecB family)
MTERKTHQLTQVEIEERLQKRAEKVAEQVRKIEQSKYHSPGWNPKFDDPRVCGGSHRVR